MVSMLSSALLFTLLVVSREITVLASMNDSVSPLSVRTVVTSTHFSTLYSLLTSADRGAITTTILRGSRSSVLNSKLSPSSRDQFSLTYSNMVSSQSSLRVSTLVEVTPMPLSRSSSGEPQLTFSSLSVTSSSPSTAISSTRIITVTPQPTTIGCDVSNSGCPSDGRVNLTEEQIGGIIFAPLFVLFTSFIVCMVLLVCVCVRVSRRKKEKAKKRRNIVRGRAPTVLTDVGYPYSGSTLSLDANAFEMQEEYFSTVASIQSQVSTEVGGRVGSAHTEHVSYDCESDDDTSTEGTNVHDEMTLRVVAVPNEYQVDCHASPYSDQTPYFEPANKEDELLLELNDLGVSEFSHDQLKLQEKLGIGQFGVVHRALCDLSYSKTPSEERDVQEVAVKTLDTEVDGVKFLQEAAIMGQFHHPNILRIIGFVSTRPMKIIIEYMDRGDLHNYLKTFVPDGGQPVPASLESLLISFSRQVSLGMMYLAFKGYVHRDLAARNVLVSSDGICKVADFGLSRELQHENYYVSHGGRIPVKWTAPEAIAFRKYSTASDVWSFGCLLYEIWSLGVKPFWNLTNQEAIVKVNTGYRLPPPPGCPRAIYEIMVKCWHPVSSERPSIANIVVSLQKPDAVVLQWATEDVASFSTLARTLGAPLNEGLGMYTSLQNLYLANGELSIQSCLDNCM